MIEICGWNVKLKGCENLYQAPNIVLHVSQTETSSVYTQTQRLNCVYRSINTPLCSYVGGQMENVGYFLALAQSKRGKKVS